MTKVVFLKRILIKNRLIYFWACLLYSLFSNAQVISHQTQQLLDSSYYYSRYDFDKCISFVDSALQSSSVNDRNYLDDLSHYYIGVCYNRSGRYDDALQYFSFGLNRMNARKDSILIADILYQQALVYRQQTQYLKFIEKINDALRIAEAINYKQKIGMCNNAKLIHFNERKMYSEAEKCGLYALKIFEAIADSSSMGDVYNNLGVMMTSQNKFDRALRYHTKQHALNVKLNNVWGKGYSHAKLANIYAIQGDKSKSIQHINDALLITESIGTPYELAGSLLKSAKVYAKLNLNTKALQNAYKAKSISVKSKQQNLYIDVLKTISEIHFTQNRLDSAIIYKDKFIAAKDSILNSNMAKELHEMEVKYDTEKKEIEIQRLALEDELSQTKISNQKFIIGGSVVAVFVLGFLLFRLRKKNIQIAKQNEVIKTALNEKEILLKEIHHRVKNNLQVISSLLGIQSRSIADQKAKDAIKEGRTRVHAMSLIHQNLYQKENLSGIDMADYLPKLSKSLFNTYNIIGERVKLITDIEPMKLSVETVIPIGLIVNELITNALKYAFPDNTTGEIEVNFKEESDKLRLTVSDNGIGLSEDQFFNKKKNFGHVLIKAFKNKLDGEILLDGNNGTSITMLIANYIKIES